MGGGKSPGAPSVYIPHSLSFAPNFFFRKGKTQVTQSDTHEKECWAVRWPDGTLDAEACGWLPGAAIDRYMGRRENEGSKWLHKLIEGYACVPAILKEKPK